MSYRETLMSGLPSSAIQVSASATIAAPPDRVATLCCAFGKIAEWHPAFSSCELEGEGVGAVRTLDMGGTPVRERLEHAADDGLGYFYSVILHPLLGADARGYIEVQRGEADGTSVLEHAIAFRPTGLIPPNAMTELARGLCEMGVAGARVKMEDDAPAWSDDDVTIPDGLRADRT